MIINYKNLLKKAMPLKDKVKVLIAEILLGYLYDDFSLYSSCDCCAFVYGACS